MDRTSSWAWCTLCAPAPELTPSVPIANNADVARVRVPSHIWPRRMGEKDAKDRMWVRMARHLRDVQQVASRLSRGMGCALRLAELALEPVTTM